MFDSYSKLGWHLFPIQARGKAPLTANGFKDASNDPEVLENWRGQFPNCNLAVAPGPSGLLIIDIDSYKGVTKADLEKHTGPLPPTAWVLTGGGGMHLYYRGSVPSRNGVIKGVDIRSESGYVLIPPSIHESGKKYDWIVPPEKGIAEATPAMLEFFRNAQPRNILKETGEEELFLGPGDARWENLRVFAGRLRAWNWSAASIEGALLSFAKHQCEPDKSISPSKLRDLAHYIGDRPGENTKQVNGRNLSEVTFNSAVKVKTPSGKIIFIPKDKLEEALSRGAVLCS